MTENVQCRKIYKANPHYYGYIYSFVLHPEKGGESGRITMCIGGGQHIFFEAEGEYILNLNDNSGILYIKNLYEEKRYNGSCNKVRLENYETPFTIEKGKHIIGPTCYKVNHLKEEVLVAEDRWVFEDDLMRMMGNESERIFYTKCVIASREELKEQGIPLCGEEIYSHYIDVRELDESLEHLTIGSSNVFPELLEMLRKLPNPFRSEIGSYYDKEGLLVGFSIGTELDIIFSEYYDIYIFQEFYIENKVYLNDIKKKIIDDIKKLACDRYIIAFPPNELFTLSELDIATVECNGERSDILEYVMPIDLTKHTIIFPLLDE